MVSEARLKRKLGTVKAYRLVLVGVMAGTRNKISSARRSLARHVLLFMSFPWRMRIKVSRPCVSRINWVLLKGCFEIISSWVGRIQLRFSCWRLEAVAYAKSRRALSKGTRHCLDKISGRACIV